MTPGRSQIVDFSYPFSNEVKELLVTAPGQPDVSSIQDLSGREIVVPAASSYFESVVSVNQQLIADGLEPIQITISDPRLEIESIIEMMNSDLLPMTVADSHRMKIWRQVFQNVKVHDDIVFRENASVALAMRKQSPELKKFLDGFVRENRVGTLVTNMLLKQFTDYTGWVKPALERDPFRRFEQLASLFQTYGGQYDFDWLMLASFAFQESGFDQDARSHVGERDADISLARAFRFELPPCALFERGFVHVQ